MVQNLSDLYDANFKKIRGKSAQGFVRPTVGEYFMTHKDFIEIAKTINVDSFRWEGVPFYNFARQENNLRNFYIKPDGTKTFIIGLQDTVHQYTLTTPWDLSTCSFDEVEFDIGDQDGTPVGIFFSSDGSKMYVLGDLNNFVYQYTLSTPWDVSSTSYDEVSFDVSSQEIYLETLCFNYDGSKMYIAGSDNESIYQYTLTTPWDLSTASYDESYFSLSDQSNDPKGFGFGSNGTKLYVPDQTSKSIYQYTLSISWDVSTASYDSVYFDFTELGLTFLGNVVFNSVGNRMHIISYDYVYQFELNENWNIGTINLPNNINWKVFYGNEARSFFIKPDGTKLYLGYEDENIYQYTLSNAWDISTATYDSVYIDIGDEDTAPNDFVFNIEGDRLYLVGASLDSVHQYSLSNAWDLSTAVYDSVTLDVSNHINILFGIFINSNNNSLYLGDINYDTIYQYNL
jgi:hypothetical protein